MAALAHPVGVPADKLLDSPGTLQHEPAPSRRLKPAAPGDRSPAAAAPPRRKLTYREQQELDKLPARVEKLEAEQQRLQADVANPGFYKEPADTIHQTLARLETLQQSILDVYARWDELDAQTPSAPSA